MVADIRFESAATWSLEALAELFVRSFADYFYPVVSSAALLAARARAEQFDFSRSLVLYVGGEPAGQALLALRGDRAWCGGFGITPPFRGQGLARSLIAEVIDQARAAGARQLSLEVITRNAKALKAYQGAGLVINRDVQILNWQANAELIAPAGIADCAPAPVRQLLGHFDALHASPAAWQRDLPALLVKSELQGLALREDGRLAAYLLFSRRDGTTRIEDLAALHPAQAVALLRTLQAQSQAIVTINEPADSPLSPAFAACGFAETERQHEMALPL